MTGTVERDGVRLVYDVHGDGETTVLLLPTSPIVHSRFWKGQIPYLSRHYRVVAFDGRGNGRSGRPREAAAYAAREFVADAVAVLDATETERAIVAGLCDGGGWALMLAAEHPERVLAVAALGPYVPHLTPTHRHWAEADFEAVRETYEGWEKANRHYWRRDLRGWLEFFFGQLFPEPHSTKQIEDCVGWGLETDGETLALAEEPPPPWESEADARELLARIECPVLVVHGTDDRCQPWTRGAAVAELTGGSLLTVEGGGHLPLARQPVLVNLALRELVDGVAGRRPGGRTWRRSLARPRRALYVSSPIGLGHVLRDCAIADELRRIVPDLEIDWLAQHPVTEVLAARGERIHPASGHLLSESAHWTREASGHELPCFQALRRMDEILLANFMVFHDVVREEPYDLWIGDEAWDLDHHLHENPELKTAPYVWLADFVGYLTTEESDDAEAALVADYNAEFLEHRERYPSLRDRSIFVGDPEDVVPDAFGPGLPSIRAWTERHYDFAGYVAEPVEPADPGDGPVCVVAVGGSGVGEALLRRVVEAYPLARELVPGLRMVAVCGPRIDPAVLPRLEGLDVRGYVPDLRRHLAASDLAVIQGGLTTAMELTAARRPFLYFPLGRHFEQQRHVRHRLERYGAGRCMDFRRDGPEEIATAIAEELGRPVGYRPVAPGGAARAAALVAEVLA